MGNFLFFIFYLPKRKDGKRGDDKQRHEFCGIMFFHKGLSGKGVWENDARTTTDFSGPSKINKKKICPYRLGQYSLSSLSCQLGLNCYCSWSQKMGPYPNSHILKRNEVIGKIRSLILIRKFNLKQSFIPYQQTWGTKRPRIWDEGYPFGLDWIGKNRMS